MEKYGKEPDANVAIGYIVLWVAIKAIEMAGTDDLEKIAQAHRPGGDCSGCPPGKLEWDTRSGHAHIIPDGTSDLKLIAERIEGGNLVYVPLPE